MVAQACKEQTKKSFDDAAYPKAHFMKGFSRSICKALSKCAAPVLAPRRVIDRCNLLHLVTLTLKNTP